MKADLLIRGGQVVTMAGERLPAGGFTDFAARREALRAALGIIEDGAVAAADGRIVAVGPRKEVEAKVTTTSRTMVVDAEGESIVPGFVDAHTHLVFSGWREEEFALRLAGASYLDIHRAGGGILRTVATTRAASLHDLVAWGFGFLDHMLAGGVTTVEAKSGYGLDLENELKQLEALRLLNKIHPIEVIPTFLGAHAVPPEFAGNPDGYIDFIRESVLPEVARRKLARFCDVFCEEGVFDVPQSRRLLLGARSLGLGLKVHADELTASGGAELAAEVGAVSADHLGFVTPEGRRRLADAGVSAVLLPATAFHLGTGHQAPARDLIADGVSIALATDFNPGSAPSASLAFTMALGVYSLSLAPEEALWAVTRGGARAVEQSHRLGALLPGYDADVVVLSAPSYLHLAYRFGENLVRLVFKRGRLAWRRTAG